MRARAIVVVAGLGGVALAACFVGCGTALVLGEDDPTASPDGATDGASEGGADGAALDGALGEVGAGAVADGGLRVFVTRSPFSGGTLKALEGELCAGRPGKFIPWISFIAADMKTRLSADGPWYTTDGKLVAMNKSDLLDGMLASPILADEQGKPINTNTNPIVWTGTTASGTVTDNCNDWASTTTSGVAGLVTSTTAWTTNAKPACTTAAHVYCFEQP